MRTVVHLLGSTCGSGSERQLLGLAQEMVPDHRTVFLTFGEQGRSRAFVRAAEQHRLEAWALQADTPRLIRAAGEIAERLRSLGADVLLCHGCKADLLGRLAGWRVGLPVVAVSRGWTGASLAVHLCELLDRCCLRWMDRVVCVSRAQADKVLRVGVKPDRVEVIGDAVDPDRFVDPDPRYRRKLTRVFRQPRSRIIGAIGRLSPEKGFDVLIAAAEIVLRRHPRHGFVIFGEGPCRSALLRQINASGLAGDVVLAGFRTDLDRIVPFFDLLVLPSVTEGLPNVVLEAFAAGIPVVAVAGSSTHEVIEDRVNGYLVSPGDPQEMADRICAALESEERLRDLGTQGRLKVLEQFTFSSQARQYASLFDQLCQPTEEQSSDGQAAATPPESPRSVQESACTR